MEASQHNVPPEVQQMADQLGVPVETIMAQVHASSRPAEQQPPAPLTTEAAPIEPAPVEAAPVEAAPVGTAAPIEEPPPVEETAPVESVGPGETETQRLQRELAESRQETDQVRRLAQTATEGRVIGSGGAGMPRTVGDLPNLGSIEPGLRYDYLNGHITDEQLADRLSPLLAALLKKHKEVGGSI